MGAYFTKRTNNMNMFRSFIDSIPKNRSEYVNDLEIPEVTLSPYIWTDLDDCLSVKSDIVPGSVEDDRGTLSTDTSMPLSRAMTDSEIDYRRYKWLKNNSYKDPWDAMKGTMDAFPPDYLASLQSFRSCYAHTPEEVAADCAKERLDTIRRYNDELRYKMKKFFDEECCVFRSDDPGLSTLEDAIKKLDLKARNLDLDHSAL